MTFPTKYFVADVAVESIVSTESPSKPQKQSVPPAEPPRIDSKDNQTCPTMSPEQLINTEQAKSKKVYLFWSIFIVLLSPSLNRESFPQSTESTLNFAENLFSSGSESDDEESEILVKLKSVSNACKISQQLNRIPEDSKSSKHTPTCIS